MLVILNGYIHMILYFKRLVVSGRVTEGVLQYTYKIFKLVYVGILIDLVHGRAGFQDVLPSFEFGDGAVICQLDNLSSM